MLQELEHMRAIADEAYQQVRDTLDELNPLPAGDLNRTVTNQARAACQRSGMGLQARQARRAVLTARRRSASKSYTSPARRCITSKNTPARKMSPCSSSG